MTARTCLRFAWMLSLLVVSLTASAGSFARDVARTLPKAGSMAHSTTGPQTQSGPPDALAVVITIDGEINSYREREIERRFKQARDKGAQVVILQLRTYGGGVGSALNISRFIKRQTDLHIICLVDEFAFSAGSMIGLACNEIVMEPNAMFGDSGVISTGSEISGQTERAKVESPVVEEFRDSARLRGYSELLAVALVQVAREVFVVENTTTGERRFVDRTEHERLLKGGSVFDTTQEWRDLPGVRVPLDDNTTILTVSAEIAEKIGLSSGTYASAEDLAQSRGYVIVQNLRPSLGDQLVAFFSSFAVQSILSAAFLLSVYMFFQAPGSGFAETLGLVSLTLLLGVPWLTGYAGWLEVVLVILGLILVIVEIFLIPGFGFFGITGIVMVLMGLTLTFMPPLLVPGMPGLAGFDPAALRNGLLGVTLGLVGSLAIWGFIGRYLPKMPYFNRLVLSSAVGSTPETGMTTITIASWPEVGAKGEALSDLRPGGTAMFPQQGPAGFATSDVVSDRGFIAKGTNVVVTEVHGNRVVVRQAP